MGFFFQNWLTGISENRLALNILARSLLSNHGDEWLNVFISTPQSRKGNRYLKSAINLNYAGNPVRAEKAARIAKNAFNHNPSGLMRADLEIVYALRRQSKGAACQREIIAAQRLLRHYRFVWLDLQFSIENSVCAGMGNDFNLAARLAARSLEYSQRSHYPALELRALALFASWNTLEDRLKQSWRANEDGLNLFWAQYLPAERAFQFYSDLETAAARSERWPLAVLLQQEVLTMISETRRVDFQALAHFRMATDLLHTGDNHAAQQEIVIADDLFGKLDRATQALFRTYSEIELARLKIHDGSLQSAARSLQLVNEQYQDTSNFSIDIPLHIAWAELAQAMGNPSREKQELERIVATIDRGLRSLKSPQQRWEWSRASENASRRLLELELGANSSARTSLLHWRNHQSLDVTISNSSNQPQEPDPHYFGAKADSVNAIFAVLNHQIVIWTVTNTQIHRHTVQIESAEVQHLIQRFYNLCSDPSSSIQKVNEASLRLYQVMIKPIEADIAGFKYLYIEADDRLGSLPWPALISGQGIYLSEEYTIAQSAGLLAKSHMPERKINRALLVYPGTVQIDGTMFPALPDAENEIRSLSTMYPNSKLLLGADATRLALIRALPSVSVFHFAGHAIGRNGGGELVLSSSGSADFLSASSLERLSLHEMDLVFLAACSSAQVEGSIVRNPYGLVWSFMSAGTRNVVASQWSVNSSSTAVFAQEFYGEYQNTSDVSTAVRRAAHAMRINHQRAHPFYWAAFQAFVHLN